MGSMFTKQQESGNTDKLQNVLEHEVKKWSQTITSMKDKRDPGGYEYLVTCMNETAANLQPYYTQSQPNKEKVCHGSSDTGSKSNEYGALRKEDEHLSQLEEKYQGEISTLKRCVKDKTSFVNQLNAVLETSNKESDNLRKENSKLIAERDELQMRLSKFASEKLKLNNPAIADLGDPNRPTKLGDIYMEIYSDEWTDAFDSLCSSGYSNHETISILRQTLLHCVEFCQKKSEELLIKTGEAIQFLFQEYNDSVKKEKTPQYNQTVYVRVHQTSDNDNTIKEIDKADEELYKLLGWKGQENVPIHTLWRSKKPTAQQKEQTRDNETIQKELKHMRKEIALALVPMVQTAYVNTCWRFDCIATLKPYIEKCLYLGWLMVIQSPPMCLCEIQVQPGTKFDKNMFREYTVSGPFIEYVVWPPMLLYESGPTVMKGVAQGKQSRLG